MPTSKLHVIPIIVNQIMRNNPQSMLDIGCGWGKYGVLAREYLEIGSGTQDYTDRKHRIDAIEGFEPYINPLHHAVYDNIYIGDAMEVLPTLEQYDLILIAGVLEHFTQEDGNTLLDLCAEKGKKTIITTPFNPSAQGAAFGNEFERHQSKWTEEDFARFEYTKIPSLNLMVEFSKKT